MDNIYALMGKTVTGKICRYGWPTATGKVIGIQGALYGNIRVLLEDNSSALMLYPDMKVQN